MPWRNASGRIPMASLKRPWGVSISVEDLALQKEVGRTAGRFSDRPGDDLVLVGYRSEMVSLRDVRWPDARPPDRNAVVR